MRSYGKWTAYLYLLPLAQYTNILGLRKGENSVKTKLDYHHSKFDNIQRTNINHRGGGS